VEIITLREQIRKFFFEKHLDFLTSVPQQRLQEIIVASCVKGNRGKMTDYSEVGTAHRTTYGHFLATGKWDDKRLEETQKRESFQTILELSRRKEAPLFVSIDDTVVRKSVPSSKAKRPTQGTGWHYSHLEGKVVYGYQVHAAIVGTGDSSLCYSLKRYCPDNGTKIDMLCKGKCYVKNIYKTQKNKGFSADATLHKIIAASVTTGSTDLRRLL